MVRSVCIRGELQHSIRSTLDSALLSNMSISAADRLQTCRLLSIMEKEERHQKNLYTCFARSEEVNGIRFFDSGKI
jgi:hypothetical protein